MATFYPLNQNFGQVGPTSIASGQPVTYFRSNEEGGFVVQELYGKYAELLGRGQVFCARPAVALAFATFAATLANAFTLLNPSTSGKIVYPLLLNLAENTAGATSTVGGANMVQIGLILNAGSGPGASLPLASSGTQTYNGVTPGNCLAGSALTSTSQYWVTMTYSAPYLATFPTNQIIDLGIGEWSNSGTMATTYTSLTNLQYDFHGFVGLKPGTALVFMTTSANTITYNTSLIIAEIPVGARILP